MSNLEELTLNVLEKAIIDDCPAIRRITRLQPAGGKGDKVFPPTYLKEGRAETKYAFEKRRIDGEEITSVLLDSVASQANRMEEALLEGWQRNELRRFPLVQVDFSAEDGLEDLEQITALQASHRIADALLRDSLLDGVPFRQTPIGKSFTDARTNHATAMYKYCPTALIFGVWDSTGPKGGLGAKFQRSVASEIVAIGALAGVKTASRIDPAGIERKAGPIYRKADEDDWTADESEAKKDKKGAAELFSRSGAEGKGQPSTINHGNIPPSIDHESGGITFDYAIQTSVLSLPALRRLRFRDDVNGNPLPPDLRSAAEDAARTALAALALAAFAYQEAQGYDLRSRSLLVTESGGALELLSRDDSEPKRYKLSKDGAAKLLADAVEKAAELGLGWDPKPVTLIPAPKLSHLIRKSREQVQAGEIEVGE
ncbi:MAG: type I-U CRISPR-associated RAMP protein Csb1/Cas7u [Gammaproteobacteria bacterium]|nr:type I-U CRISPR-associated RAMP protein Csb1/Cas7u [Gammaproteobacteria bacterium]